MKFVSLVKNELIKLFSKKSTFVFIIIILAFSLLWGLIDYEDIDRLFSGGYDDDTETVDGADDLPEYNGWYDDTKGYFKANVERAIKAGVKKDDWRADYYLQIQSDTNNIYWALSDIENYGEYVKTEEESVKEIEKWLSEHEEDTESEEYTEQANSLNEHKLNIEIYKSNLEMAKTNLETYTNSNDALWQIIEKGSYADLVKTQYEEAKAYIKTVKDFFENGKKQLASEGASEAEIKAFEAIGESVKNSCDAAERAYNHVIDKNLEGTLILCTEMNTIFDNLSSVANVEFSENGIYYNYYGYGGISLASKKMYTEYEETVSENGGSVESYEKYLKKASKPFEKIAACVSVASTAVEKDIKEMTVVNGARNKFRGILTFSFYEYISYFGILLCGIIVASEYSRKTINMLVIRPVSRSKLLAAKYVAAVGTTLALTVLTLLTGFIFCGIRYGFADYFESFVGYSNGSTYVVPYILWFLGKAAVAWVGVLFIMTLAFFFSTLTKTAAVALIVPILASSFLEAINMLAFQIIPNVMKYLPTTYVGLWSYIFKDVAVVGEVSDFDIGAIIGELFGDTDVNLALGALMLLALTAMLYFFSDLIFRKRDVK